MFVLHDRSDGPRQARPDAGRTTRFTTAEVEVGLARGPYGLDVTIACPNADLSWVVLRWRRRVAASALVLGDAWERSYGDLSWRHLQPERLLPWSWLAHDPVSTTTTGMGVRVRPNAFCAWTVDEDGCSLWLDVRNGGGAVTLGERVLSAATVVEVAGDATASPYAVQRGLTAAMCADPLPLAEPVVGANNWYYAYGRDFGPAQILRDAETIVSYADGHPVRPFCVVDAGWSPGGVCPGGPWTAGVHGLFDDMPASPRTSRRAVPGRGSGCAPQRCPP